MGDCHTERYEMEQDIKTADDELRYCEDTKAKSEQVGGNHYKSLRIQPAEFSEKNGLSFLEGCVVKRICRHESKDGIEDLKKAIHEIRLIAKFKYGVEL